MSIATQAPTIATQQPGTSTDPLWSPESYNQLVTDAAAFSITIDNGKRDAIQWIAATDELIVGTAASEYRITGKKDKAISAQGYRVSQQTIHGSKDMQPLITDRAILFVDSVGRQLREFKSYGKHYWHKQYIAPNLLVLAEHITQPNTIRTMAYQKKPESILWATLSNGDLITCTYDPKQKVVAWAQHPLPIGEGQTEASELTGTYDTAGDYTEYFIGCDYVSGTDQNIVLKLTTSHTKDTDWGDSGTWHYDGANGGTTTCLDLVQLDDGRLLVLHNTFWIEGGSLPTGKLVCAAMLDSDGVLDTTWGYNGFYVVRETGADYGTFIPKKILQDSSGNFHLFGQGRYAYRIFDSTGTNLYVFDCWYGGLTIPGSYFDATFDSDGDTIIAAAYATVITGQTYFNVVAFNTADGSVDTNFTGNLGSPGRAIVGPTGLDRKNAYGIKRVSDGYVVAYYYVSDGVNNIAKITTTGTIDTTWGNSGYNNVGFYVGEKWAITNINDVIYTVARHSVADQTRCRVMELDATGQIDDQVVTDVGSTDLYHSIRAINGSLWIGTRGGAAPASNQVENWDTTLTYQDGYDDGIPYVVAMLEDETTQGTSSTAWTDSSIGIGANSVCVIPGPTEDEVWISVGRKVDGDLVRYVERMKPFHWSDQEDCFFVDSGVTYDSTPTTTMTGLDHLEGETVAVLGDGLVQTSQTVSSGEITVTEASVIQAGLPYTYTLKPMRLDQNYNGTTKGSTKRIAEVVIDFENSNGTQYDNGEDTYDVDFPDTDVYTGDIVVHADGGFNVEDPFEITSSAPLPCTIRAIVPRLEMTGR